MKRISLITESPGKLSNCSFLRKIKQEKKVTLAKNEEITFYDANTLSTFFLNIVKNLKIPEKFADSNLPQTLWRHATLNAILKYKEQPNIRIIKRVSLFSSFCCSLVNKKNYS